MVEKLQRVKNVRYIIFDQSYSLSKKKKKRIKSNQSHRKFHRYSKSRRVLNGKLGEIGRSVSYIYNVRGISRTRAPSNERMRFPRLSLTRPTTKSMEVSSHCPFAKINALYETTEEVYSIRFQSVPFLYKKTTTTKISRVVQLLRTWWSSKKKAEGRRVARVIIFTAPDCSMVRDPSCSHTNNDITNRPLIEEPMPFTFSIEEEETDLECPKTLLLAFSPNRYLIVSDSEYTIEVKSSAYSRLRYPLRGPTVN